MVERSPAGALKGIKVIDLSRMVPGPYCSMILADHGAEVIAIESRKLADDGLAFDDLNRNKRHMSLNLKSEKGLKIFYKLAAEVDVVIEGFRPGVVQRLGVDYETIKKFNSDIIYCSITGYGQTGAKRMVAGHDVNYISESGILDLIGGADDPPTIPGIQIADIAGGSINGTMGILLALFARDRGAGGQYIDISITDGTLGLLTLANHFSTKSGNPPKRSAEMLSHKYGCYNTYETLDNRYLSIGALEPKFWQNLCELLERPALASLQYSDNRREEVIHELREIFKAKKLDEWVTLLGEAEVCFSPVKTMAEVVDDPLFKDREMIHSFTGNDGKLHYGFGSPVKLEKTPVSMRTKPCRFGEHTDEILEELGYSRAEIETLYKNGIV